MGRRIAVAGSLLIALLGAPRASEAGLIEIIWEMSGPQMIGFGYTCMYSIPTGTRQQCSISRRLIEQYRETATKKGPFLVVGGSIMGSTGVNSSTEDYRWGEIWRVAFEPGVVVRSYDVGAGAVQVHHGVGVSFERLFGRDIRPFDKFGITVTPVDVAFRRVGFGIKLRMYPDGFTDDEFKPGRRVSKDRPFETTIGFTFNLILDKH